MKWKEALKMTADAALAILVALLLTVAFATVWEHLDADAGTQAHAQTAAAHAEARR